jgi:hypothetical protein
MRSADEGSDIEKKLVMGSIQVSLAAGALPYDYHQSTLPQKKTCMQ